MSGHITPRKHTNSRHKKEGKGDTIADQITTHHAPIYWKVILARDPSATPFPKPDSDFVEKVNLILRLTQ